MIEGIAPSVGRASGGTRVDISGAGFDIRESYFCLFSRGAESLAFSANVGSGSASALSCDTPVGVAAWGYQNAGISDVAELPAGGASLLAYRTTGVTAALVNDISNDDSSLVVNGVWSVGAGPVRLGGEFVLLGNATNAGAHTNFSIITRGAWGSSPAAHSAGAPISLLTPVQANPSFMSQRKFAFVAEWSKTSAVYEEASSRVSLVIDGSGFGGASRYFARLAAGNNILDSAPVYASALSQLLILTPPWTFGVDAPAAITVHREGSGATVNPTP